jgi:ABC-2 type transport system permease protein
MKPIEALIGILQWPATFLGADHAQFGILLRTKLLLNSRTEFTSFSGSSGRKTSFWYQMFLISIIGAIFGLMLLFIDDIKSGMIFFYTFLMFVLGMTLLAESTSILFDKRDNHILLPRPVSRRTLLFTRIIHVQIYTGLIAVACSAGVAVVLIFKFSLVLFLIFLISIGFLSWLTLEITMLVYLAIARVVEKERFKDIINFIQIGFVIMMTIGYQLIGRIESSGIFHSAKFPVWISYVLPPFWFTNVIRLGNMETLGSHEMITVALAIVVPVSGVILLVRFFSGGFEKLLASMDVESTKPKKASKFFSPGVLRKLMCTSTAEIAGWDLAIATTSRDRKFKVNVYPSYFMMAVFCVMLMIPGIIDGFASGDFSFILATIIAGFGGFNGLLMLQYTDTPEASWVYRAMPVKEYGRIFTGAVKAIFVKFFMPLSIIVLTAAILFRGPSLILHVLQGLTGSYFLALLILLLRGHEMPFSQNYDAMDKGMMTTAGLLLLIVSLCLGGVLFITTFLPAWFPLILIAAFSVMIHFILRRLGSEYFKPDPVTG